MSTAQSIPAMLNEPAQQITAHRGRSVIWDVILIGSGTGSLAAAATLARFGKSVLVLEAHSQLGGLTHTFTRRKMQWGTGLHYTGWPTAYFNDFPHLWEQLTAGQARWKRLPESTDSYVRSDGLFIKRGPRERYREDLYNAFPAERRVIDRYLEDMKQITAAYLRFMTLQSVSPMVEQCGLGWLLGRRFLAHDRLPLIGYMDRIEASERLREHLWFTWGNFGGVPDNTSVGAYAVPMEFMMDGLWTVADGSSCVAEAFARTIRACGGELRRNALVDELVFHGGRVVGVRVGGEELCARHVISGIGARETYRRLVPESHRPQHAERILAMQPSCSILTLYLALRPSVLTTYGLHGVNYWVEGEPNSMRTWWRDFSRPPSWFVLSLAARFQQENQACERIPGEIFVGIPGSHFTRYRNARVMKRGRDYDEFKEDLVQKTMARVERTWPGFGQHIEFMEAATPATIRSYTGHSCGAAYGIAPVPGRYSERGLRAASGIPGLLLCGQDVAAAGVIGAFYGGLAAASALLKRNTAQRLLHRCS